MKISQSKRKVVAKMNIKLFKFGYFISNLNNLENELIYNYNIIF